MGVMMGFDEQKCSLSAAAVIFSEVSARLPSKYCTLVVRNVN